MKSEMTLQAYALGETLYLIDPQTALEQNIPCIYLASVKDAGEILKKTEMRYEGELAISDIAFSKVETQQDCMWGSFFIPKLIDVQRSRYRIFFFINGKDIVLISEDDFPRRLIARIQFRKIHQGDTKEKFLYNFIGEFMARDFAVLAEYEKRLMETEREILEDKMNGIQNRIIPIRNELRILREYYDEIADVGRELEENENRYFRKNQLKYFGTISDRAERLKEKTIHLLDYAQQVNDLYQAGIDARQNSNMQFLTIISTVFFPLTLITGWYGMNFENMPELEKGYPGVIVLSLCVIGLCYFIFKKKHIL